MWMGAPWPGKTKHKSRMAGVEELELNLTDAFPKQSNGSATRLSFAKAVSLMVARKDGSCQLAIIC
jgi:hypothetical protein